MATENRGNPKTEERLVSAAVSLFARKWYGTVSVAEICRAAGLSNGVFYRYYDGKETLFKAILGRVLEQIREAVEGAQGASTEDRLHAFSDAIIQFSADHPDLISVFREGQYRFYDYERRLVAIYQRGLGEALGREVGLAEYLFALGGLRFCAVGQALQGAKVDIPSVSAILNRGLYRRMGFDPARVFGGTATPLPVPLEETARERLLRSGRRLFGEKGFFETNIHEITAGADLSVGAFYTYFESKETFYAELIRLVSHDVRAFISKNLAETGLDDFNALELELRGLWLWIVYLSIDRNCYNIVREAEFVLPAVVTEYYDGFRAGYHRRADRHRATLAAPEVDEDTAIQYLMGLAHYFGIQTAFDDSLGSARSLVETIGAYLSRGFSDDLI
ncbi:TetR/AcrR family transcriptional regulator [Mesoterricola sediminis]|uniref:TetR family transcriptional regulator n=1 Tax=Mesoterricola sediminis TaxID=2927980 RepID=A0AA48H7U5_9BACT|nr:TetR/AcrR family transcriptional regulator [Mesoterricola sediminis]BDU77533.1 TetR family transcriptional regulator [Mesoterricola sediminis]